MSVRTMADSKRKTTRAVTPSLGLTSQHRAAPAQHVNAMPLSTDTKPGVAYDLSRMSIYPTTTPTPQTCCLSNSPRACPFGGACHVCPTRANANTVSPKDENGSPASVAAPPVAAAPAAPACASGAQAEKMSACIQPVVIADDDGKNPTTAPSFGQVTAIWGKCCIDYTVSAAKTVKKKAYKTLEESPTNVPSNEEKDLFKDAGASSCIQVFVPATFSQGKRTGKDISGGGGTYDAGTANPKIVVVEGTVSEVVAHEVGHASGYAAHDANNTVMKPTGAHDKPNSTAVSADVCSKARTGSVLKKAGAAKDCCMTVS